MKLSLDRQQPFDWHHNFPQVFKSYFKSKGISINDGVNGVIMLQGDHLAFKDAFNNAWDEFINSEEGRNACPDQIKKHFQEKIRPQFDEHYKRSVPAGESYSKWSKRAPTDKLEVGTDKLGKVIAGLAVLGIISETASAAEWMNRDDVSEKMSEFADLMAETDPLTKQIGLTTWYMENFPGIADPMTSFSKNFGSQANIPWSADLVAKFKGSFKTQEDIE